MGGSLNRRLIGSVGLQQGLHVPLELNKASHQLTGSKEGNISPKGQDAVRRRMNGLENDNNLVARTLMRSQVCPARAAFLRKPSK